MAFIEPIFILRYYFFLGQCLHTTKSKKSNFSYYFGTFLRPNSSQVHCTSYVSSMLGSNRGSTYFLADQDKSKPADFDLK